MGFTLSEILQEQQKQALGPVNKWYCSQSYGYEVTDCETLLRYYIKNGGAQNFRQLCDSGQVQRGVAQSA